MLEPYENVPVCSCIIELALINLNLSELNLLIILFFRVCSNFYASKNYFTQFKFLKVTNTVI